MYCKIWSFVFHHLHIPQGNVILIIFRKKTFFYSFITIFSENKNKKNSKIICFWCLWTGKKIYDFTLEVFFCFLNLYFEILLCRGGKYDFKCLKTITKFCTIQEINFANIFIKFLEKMMLQKSCVMKYV